MIVQQTDRQGDFPIRRTISARSVGQSLASSLRISVPLMASISLQEKTCEKLYGSGRGGGSAGSKVQRDSILAISYCKVASQFAVMPQKKG